MVAGLEQLDGSEIVLRGRLVASAAAGHFEPPEKRNLGMVFQCYAIVGAARFERGEVFAGPREDAGPRQTTDQVRTLC